MIPRHEFDKESISSKYTSSQKMIELVLSKPVLNANHLHFLLEDSLISVCCGLALQDEKNKLADFLKHAFYAGKSLLLPFVDNPGIATPENAYAPVSREDAAGRTSITTWFQAFYLASILRHPASYTWLSTLDVNLLAEKGVQIDIHQYTFARFIQAWIICRDQPENESKPRLMLGAVMADADMLQSVSKDWLTMLSLPEIDAWRSLIENDEEQFNRSLEKAVIAFKKYYNRNTPLNKGGRSLKNYPNGLFSLNLTGLAAIAYDKGWKITVKSDYMPEWMVKGLF